MTKKWRYRDLRCWALSFLPIILISQAIFSQTATGISPSTPAIISNWQKIEFQAELFADRISGSAIFDPLIEQVSEQHKLAPLSASIIDLQFVNKNTGESNHANSFFDGGGNAIISFDGNREKALNANWIQYLDADWMQSTDRLVSIDFPIAATGTFELTTSLDLEIAQSSLPHKPNDVASSEGLRSWLFVCGASNNLQVRFQDASQTNSSIRQCYKSEQTDWNIQSTGLEVEAKYLFQGNIPDIIKVRIDDDLKIRDLTWDGQSVNWSFDSAAALIKFQPFLFVDSRSISQHRLVITATSAWPTRDNTSSDSKNALPAIHLANAIPIEGRGSINIHSDWMVTAVRVDDANITSRSGSTSEGSVGRLELEWQLADPKFYLSLRPRKRNQRATLVARLTSQANSVKALVAARIDLLPETSNRVLMQINKGWKLQSVRGLNAKIHTLSTTANSNKLKTESIDAEQYLIAVESDFSQARLDLELNLEYVNKSANINSNSKLSTAFPKKSPFTFPDIAQQTIYEYISPSGFIIADNEESTATAVQMNNLSTWQIENLSGNPNTLLLKSVTDDIPSISYSKDRTQDEFINFIELEENEDLVDVKQTLFCTPGPSGVQQLNLEPPLDTEIFQYRILCADNNFNRDWVAIRLGSGGIEAAGPSSSIDAINITFDQIMVDRFAIECKYRLHATRKKYNLSLLQDNSKTLKIVGVGKYFEETNQRLFTTNRLGENTTLAAFDQLQQWANLDESNTESRLWDLTDAQINLNPNNVINSLLDIPFDRRSEQVVVSADENPVCILTLYSAVGRQQPIDVVFPVNWDLKSAIINSQPVAYTDDLVGKDRIWHLMPSSQSAQVSGVIGQEIQCVFKSNLWQFEHGITELVLPHKEDLPDAIISSRQISLSTSYDLVQQPFASNSIMMRFANPYLFQLGRGQFAHDMPWRWSDKFLDDNALGMMQTNQSRRLKNESSIKADFTLLDVLERDSVLYIGYKQSIIFHRIVLFLVAAIIAAFLKNLSLWFPGILLLGSAMAAYIQNADYLCITFFLASLFGSLASSLFGFLISSNTTSTLKDNSDEQCSNRLNKISRLGRKIRTAICIAGVAILVPNPPDILLADEIDPQKLAFSSVENRLVAASHELNIKAEAKFAQSRNATLISRYVFDITSTDAYLRFPCAIENAIFNGLTVNGNPLDIDSDVSFQSDSLLYRSNQPGRVTIVLKLDLRVDSRAKPSESIRCKVLPVATATLETDHDLKKIEIAIRDRSVISSKTHDLQYLGEQNFIQAEWDSGFISDTDTEKVTYEVDTTLRLNETVPLVQTKFRLRNYRRLQPLEIEWNSEWELVSTDIKDVRFIVSELAPRLGKSHARLKFIAGFDTERPTAEFELFWRPISSSTPNLSLLKPRFINSTLEQELIHFSDSASNHWTLIGVERWLPSFAAGNPVLSNGVMVPDKQKILRVSESDNSAFLVQSKKTSATISNVVYKYLISESDTRFQYEASFEDEARVAQILDWSIEHGVKIESVSINGSEVLYCLNTISNSHRRLQAFVDPDRPTISSILITGRAPHPGFSWKKLPDLTSLSFISQIVETAVYTQPNSTILIDSQYDLADAIKPVIQTLTLIDLKQSPFLRLLKLTSAGISSQVQLENTTLQDYHDSIRFKVAKFKESPDEALLLKASKTPLGWSVEGVLKYKPSSEKRGFFFQVKQSHLVDFNFTPSAQLIGQLNDTELIYIPYEKTDNEYKVTKVFDYYAVAKDKSFDILPTLLFEDITDLPVYLQLPKQNDGVDLQWNIGEWTANPKITDELTQLFPDRSIDEDLVCKNMGAMAKVTLRPAQELRGSSGFKLIAIDCCSRLRFDEIRAVLFVSTCAGDIIQLHLPRGFHAQARILSSTAKLGPWLEDDQVSTNQATKNIRIKSLQSGIQLIELVGQFEPINGFDKNVMDMEITINDGPLQFAESVITRGLKHTKSQIHPSESNPIEFLLRQIFATIDVSEQKKEDDNGWRKQTGFFEICDLIQEIWCMEEAEMIGAEVKEGLLVQYQQRFSNGAALVKQIDRASFFLDQNSNSRWIWSESETLTHKAGQNENEIITLTSYIPALVWVSIIVVATILLLIESKTSQLHVLDMKRPWRLLCLLACLSAVLTDYYAVSLALAAIATLVCSRAYITGLQEFNDVWI